MFNPALGQVPALRIEHVIHAVTPVIVDADESSGRGGHGGLDDGGWSVMLHRQTLSHIGGSVVKRPQL